MNKQDKRPKGGRGIEWTDYTGNPITGCQHACRWKMPDGSVAICYAEEVAKGVASHAYSQGFEHHYWNEQRLNEPLNLKVPAKIFPDSMADLFGAWVPDEQKRAVLDVMRRADWHTFQSLTKAPAIGLQYNDILPPNLWFGASVPPTFFKGRELNVEQQTRMLQRTLEALGRIKTPVRWLSVEPLSFDVAPILEQYPGVIQWVVIGAASNGKRKYQPKAEWVQNTINVLDQQGVKAFFKGNLQWSPWREEFPDTAPQYPASPVTALVQPTLF
jgi:protein gp37